MRLLSQSLILLIKIYYDLNCIDLPEFFEDHLNDFMPLFQKYLVYGNTLIDSDDEEEAGPLEKIKTCICEVLELYTLKYQDLVPQLPSFTPIVYELLATAGREGKYDAVRQTVLCIHQRGLFTFALQMVGRGLSLLTSMLKVENLAGVFSQTETMKNMCEKIALPNIAMRGMWSINESIANWKKTINMCMQMSMRNCLKTTRSNISAEIWKVRMRILAAVLLQTFWDATSIDTKPRLHRSCLNISHIIWRYYPSNWSKNRLLNLCP